MKLINSILFYVIVTVGVLFTFNGNVNFFNFMGLGILWFEYNELKKYSENEIMNILGITWFQPKFKNNPVIMDMTNE